MELSDLSRFAIQGRSGFGMVDAETHEERAPGVPGGFWLGEVAKVRHIRLALSAWADTEAALASLRSELIDKLNPRLGEGRLRVVRPWGVVREIYCVPTGRLSFDTPAPGGPLAIVDAIELRAYRPFWYDPSPQSASPTLGTGTVFTFPMTFPVAFGSGAVDVNVVLVNPGHEPAPLHVEFAGACSDPKIENVTQGKEVEVEVTLIAGERLRLKTGVWQGEVVHVDGGGVETNLRGALSAGSDLVGLAALPGSNTFRLSATGASGLSATVQFYPLYRGI